MRTIPSVHERTLPRAASKRAPLRQTEMKASWVTSSATERVADDPVGERVGGPAVAVVEDRERVGVAPLDQSHQVLVGESLQRLGCEPFSHLTPVRSQARIGSSVRERSDSGTVRTRPEEVPALSASSPARLYCTLVGAALVIAGIIGFFYSAGFDTGVSGVRGDTDEVFGILGVNGWHNLVHIALGLLALAVAGSPSGARTYCLARRASSTWCWRSGASPTPTESCSGQCPSTTSDNFLHLILGLVGLAAGAATPTVAKATRSRPARKDEAEAKA